MRGTGKNFGGSRIDQRLSRFHQRSGRIDDVVDDQTGASPHVSNHVHHFGHVHVCAPLVHNGQGCIHFLGEETRALHATRIRRNHGQMGQLHLSEVVHQHR